MPKKNELVAQAEALAAEVRAWLRELRRHHASGDLMKLDEAMGKKRGYCATLLRDPTPHEISTGVRRRLGVEEVFQLLLALGIDPRERFRGPFGFDLDLYLGRLERQKRHQVRTLQQRLAKTLPVEASLEELGRMAEELEQLRLTKPRKGKAQAFRVLASLAELPDCDEKAQIECEAWGGLAGLQRITATFSAAAHCLRNAFKTATKFGFAQAEALLLRRACYLISDQGDFELALQCSRESRALYLMEADIPGFTKGLLDGAIMLRRIGRLQEAMESYRKCLRLLDPEDSPERFGVYQGLGLCYVDLGEIEDAASCLRSMRSIIPHPTPDRMRLAVLSLEGEIALKQSDHQAAERAFREIRDIVIRGENVPELAVMSLRLAHTLLLSGKHDELEELTRAMLALPARIQTNRLAQAALNEFLRSAMTGQISASLIEKLYRRLTGGTLNTEVPRST